MEALFAALCGADSAKRDAVAQQIMALLRGKDDQIIQQEQRLLQQQQLLSELEGQRLHWQGTEQHLRHEKQLLVQELRETVARTTQLEESFLSLKDQPPPGPSPEETHLREQAAALKRQISELETSNQKGRLEVQRLQLELSRYEAELNTRASKILSLEQEQGLAHQKLQQYEEQIHNLDGKRQRSEENHKHSVVALEERLHHLQERAADAQSRLQQRDDQIVAAQISYEKAQLVADSLQRQLDDAQRERHALQLALEQRQLSLTEAETRAQQLTSLRELAEQESDALRAKVRAMERTDDENRQRIHELQNSLATAQSRVDELEVAAQVEPLPDPKLVATEHRSERLERALQEKNFQVQSLRKDLQAVTSTAAEVERQMSEYAAQLAVARQQEQQTAEKLSHATKLLEEVTSAHQHTLQLNQLLQGETNTLKSAIVQHQHSVAWAEGEVGGLRRAIDELKEKRAKAEDKLREIKAYATRVKSERDAARDELQQRQQESQRQQEQLTSAIRKLTDDNAALHAQLQQAQHKSTTDAERVRQELDALRRNHAEAVQLAAVQQEKSASCVRERDVSVAALQSRLRKKEDECTELQQRVQVLERVKSEAESETRLAVAKSTTLSKEIASIRKASQGDVQRLTQQLEGLQKSIRSEEEWIDMQAQIKLANDTLRAVREDCQRKGKIIARLKEQIEQEAARHSQEHQSTLQAKDKSLRKDWKRVTSFVAELKGRLSLTTQEMRQLEDEIQRLEGQVEESERERDQKAHLLKATRSSYEQRQARVSSQLTQVITWLVRRCEDLTRHLLRHRKIICQSPVVSPLPDSFPLESSLSTHKSPFSAALHGQIPVVSPLPSYLQRLQLGIEGRPLTLPSSDVNTSGRLDDFSEVEDLPSLFTHLINKRVTAELLAFRLFMQTSPACVEPVRE
eukprot:TRINITY_DN4728_c0_g1_i1.p1 TRINITY_DN4728_c0_g1~~TRINITY_DN4728_c0_g1_i1.p1  ORF type:complete len:919 (-),score=184.47 TRINITY_DN4728_c0_g1_i1:96-2852(-)